jgi:hypothetical protein
MTLDFAVLIAGILIVIVLFFFLKDLVKIVINSILGILILFGVNYFHLMEPLGRPDIPINIITVLLCILGGIPGAFLTIILHLLEIGGF